PHGRRDKMWPVYMAGGAGFEWYVQEDGGGHSFDQRIDDFSEMEVALRWAGHAVGLLSALPLDSMTPDRTLASSSTSGEVYTLAQAGEVYLVYHDRAGGPLTLDMQAAGPQTFDVRWFDPREGGALQLGNVVQVQGGSNAVNLGSSPHTQDDDWVCLVLRQVLSPIFADAFESGDTSAWSSTEP
ncbi:MAG: putative collagen-binding domain-containing protein, partial [Acidobacteriota bacterium]